MRSYYIRYILIFSLKISSGPCTSEHLGPLRSLEGLHVSPRYRQTRVSQFIPLSVRCLEFSAFQRICPWIHNVITVFLLNTFSEVWFPGDRVFLTSGGSPHSPVSLTAQAAPLTPTPSSRAPVLMLGANARSWLCAYPWNMHS